MDAAFGNWLAGFIDGEGCFAVKSSRNRDSPVVYHRCSFALQVRIDDQPVLDEICRETGIGRVTRVQARGHRNTTVVWSVVSKDHCLKLVALLEQFPLRAKKAKDFEIWKRAVLLWTGLPKGNRHHGPAAERDALADLKALLQSSRSYRPAV